MKEGISLRDWLAYKATKILDDINTGSVDLCSATRNRFTSKGQLTKFIFSCYTLIPVSSKITRLSYCGATKTVEVSYVCGRENKKKVMYKKFASSVGDNSLFFELLVTHLQQINGNGPKYYV